MRSIISSNHIVKKNQNPIELVKKSVVKILYIKNDSFIVRDKSSINTARSNFILRFCLKHNNSK